ncbi:MAG: 3-phosphoshikimate 1-carboxyvinyltransferase [Thermoanaerobaculia bacterium]
MTGWWSSSTEVEVPRGRRIAGTVRPPSSKSLTHRALALALLGRQPTVVVRPLEAEDTNLFLAALRALEFRVETFANGIAIEPPKVLPSTADLFCGNAGTMFRLVAAIAATLPGRYRIDGVERLRERPIHPLTGALQRLGVRIEFEKSEGHAPLIVEGGRLEGGSVELDASASSQYVSALLLAGQRATSPLEISAPALVSGPYVDLTVGMIERFGGRVEARGGNRWISHPSDLRPTEVEIEADFSAAAYPAAAAAITGGEVRIDAVAGTSRQGDRRFFDLLQAMGATVTWTATGAIVAGGRHGSAGSAGSGLHAITADLSDIPDQVPTLAALAPFARGTTRIENVAHLRVKESDRLAAMTSELRRVGAEVEELAGGLVIPGIWAESPPPDSPVAVEAHGDHRIAMAMALVGLRRPGVGIQDPRCVGKSYPDFWRDLARLCGDAE